MPATKSARAGVRLRQPQCVWQDRGQVTAHDEPEEDEDDEEDIKRMGDDRILTAQYVISHFRNLLPKGSQSLPRFGSYARVLDRGNYPFSPAKSKTILGVCRRRLDFARPSLHDWYSRYH